MYDEAGITNLKVKVLIIKDGLVEQYDEDGQKLVSQESLLRPDEQGHLEC
jgi:hypothetical protein